MISRRVLANMDITKHKAYLGKHVNTMVSKVTQMNWGAQVTRTSIQELWAIEPFYHDTTPDGALYHRGNYTQAENTQRQRQGVFHLKTLWLMPKHDKVTSLCPLC